MEAQNGKIIIYATYYNNHHVYNAHIYLFDPKSFTPRILDFASLDFPAMKGTEYIDDATLIKLGFGTYAYYWFVVYTVLKNIKTQKVLHKTITVADYDKYAIGDLFLYARKNLADNDTFLANFFIKKQQEYPHFYKWGMNCITHI